MDYLRDFFCAVDCFAGFLYFSFYCTKDCVLSRYGGGDDWCLWTIAFDQLEAIRAKKYFFKFSLALFFT